MEGPEWRSLTRRAERPWVHEGETTPMQSSECRAYSTGDGCAAHGLSDCLCDVQPIAGGVPIRSVPFAERLAALGQDRFAFVEWAEAVSAWLDSQATSADLRLV